MTGPLVLVEWVDIVSCDDWESIDAALKTEPAVCYIVGWLVHDDVHKMVIAHCRSEDEVHGYHVLPKACVVRTTKIHV